MISLYLAGPDVFLPDAAAIGLRKKALCAAYGFQGLFPLDNEIAAVAGGLPVDRIIYQMNMRMIAQADAAICNLTPFRGPSADAGTVFEVGALVGLGKPVFAYSNDPDDYASRVRGGWPRGESLPTGALHDADGLVIEDFGQSDNLMIAWGVVEAGGLPVLRHRPRGSPFTDLEGFDACLRLAAERLRPISS